MKLSNTLEPQEVLMPWVQKISFCDEEGNETQCYNLNTTDFPIKGSLDIPMYQICMDLLKIPLQLKSDDTNNANPEQ